MSFLRHCLSLSVSFGEGGLLVCLAVVVSPRDHLSVSLQRVADKGTPPRQFLQLEFMHALQTGPSPQLSKPAFRLQRVRSQVEHFQLPRYVGIQKVLD